MSVFCSHFGRRTLEKWSGRRDLNPRPLDPQDGGLAVLAGQPGPAGGAVGEPTCSLSTRMHVVWSPAGPQELRSGLAVVSQRRQAQGASPAETGCLEGTARLPWNVAHLGPPMSGCLGMGADRRTRWCRVFGVRPVGAWRSNHNLTCAQSPGRRLHRRASCLGGYRWRPF
jgi:hypothetical protein